MMTAFRDKLGTEEVISLEVTPPHGPALAGVEPMLAVARGRADILGLTDNAMAQVKMSAIALGALVQDAHGVEVMVNLGMRDRNRLALQADLLGAHALGLRTIVALKGDTPDVGDQPDAAGVFEGNALLLLKIIRELNAGRDLAGKPLDGPTDLLAGTVTNPTHENRAAEAARLGRRAEAGAAFALTQPVYDLSQLTEYLNGCPARIPLLLVGLLPLKSLKFAKFLATKVPGVHIPPDIVNLMKNAGGRSAETETGLALARDLAEEIRRMAHPAIAGFHIMTAGTDSLALKLLRELRPTGSACRQQRASNGI